MRRTTAVLVLAVGLLTAACSSTEQGTATAAGSAGSSSAPAPTSSGAAGGSSAAGSSSAAAPSADLQSLALTATDFPAPYKLQQLPPGALAQGAGALAGAQITPPECAAASQLGGGADLTNAGVAVATDATTSSTLVAVVTPATAQLAQLDGVVQACSSFTVSLPSAGGSTATASLSKLPDPQVDADTARAISTTTTVQAAGTSLTLTTVVYVAELRGLQVSVAGSGAPGSTVDQAVLADLLTKAVAKVAAG